MYRNYVSYEFVNRPNEDFGAEFASDFRHIYLDWDVFRHDLWYECVEVNQIVFRVCMFSDSEAVHGLGAVEASEAFGVPLEWKHVPIAEDG